MTGKMNSITPLKPMVVLRKHLVMQVHQLKLSKEKIRAMRLLREGRKPSRLPEKYHWVPMAQERKRKRLTKEMKVFRALKEFIKFTTHRTFLMYQID